MSVVISEIAILLGGCNKLIVPELITDHIFIDYSAPIIVVRVFTMYDAVNIN